MEQNNESKDKVSYLENEREIFYDQFGFTTQKKKAKLPLVPILYSHRYNISFLGLEKMHPFDSCKYRNIVYFLTTTGENPLSLKQFIEPIAEPSQEILESVHTKEYLQSLKWSKNVAYITEIFFVAMLPNFLVRSRVLVPMLFATSGSILAGKVAMEKGWAINLSGGYHHCCGYRGGGFCAYADITLSYRILREKYSQIKKVLIIDLDAHQGNGHERDKLKAGDNDTYIMDMFNTDIYPGDTEALAGINLAIPLRSGTPTETYISKLRNGIKKVMESFTPDVIYYNAGTDILEGDPLGMLDISPEGVIERDQIVFQYAFDNKIPIVMLLSGGYQRSNAQVIANSIQNLDSAFALLK